MRTEKKEGILKQVFLYYLRMIQGGGGAGVSFTGRELKYALYGM